MTTTLEPDRSHVICRDSAVITLHAKPRAPKRLERTERGYIAAEQRRVCERTVVLVGEMDNRERCRGPQKADVRRMIVECTLHRLEWLLEAAAGGTKRSDRAERRQQRARVVRRARAIGIADVGNERALDQRAPVAQRSIPAAAAA